MTDGMPKGFGRLTGKCPPGSIGDRDGNHHRQAKSNLIENLLHRPKGCLEVQRVKGRLRQKNIHSPLDQRPDLLRVRFRKLAKSHRPILRTIHIRRHGGRSIGRAHGSGDPGLFSGMVGQKLVRHFSGQTGRRQIHLPDRPLETIIGLGDGRGVERIRFNDPGSRLQILPVNLANHIRTGDHQNIIISL